MSAGPAEVLGLTQSIAYAQHLAEQAGQHGPAGNEGYLTRLATARVTGDGLTSAREMQDAFADAAAAAAGHAAELAKQTGVQEAYDQSPDAGDKDFQTGDTGTGGPATHAIDLGKATPVTEDESADAVYDRALGFIDATTRSHPQQAPPGQDLQHRPAESYEDDDEQPWMSLPVRSTDVCKHVDTVCSECLESWSWGHDLRVAEVPTAVDVDEHRSTADEFYVFEGDSERRLPPYWVARHDRVVTSQIEDRPVSTALLEDDDRASATFAAECCDTTPSGPGAPRPGDRIEIAGEPDTGIGATAVTVSSSTPQGDRYEVMGIDEDGQPFENVIGAWDYEIVRRPAQQPAAPEAQPEPARQQEQQETMDLSTLTPGDRVTAYGSVWLYAGTHNGDAVLVEDLRADLDYGYTGHPENGFLTATASAETHRAVLVSARQLSRA
jgi:hypothetical protein